MSWVLLASSRTLEGVEQLVNAFWCGQDYRVSETLEITHPKRKVPEGVRIVRKSGRYRFEREVRS